LEWDYKIRPYSEHVAKFQGDRSRELGERMAKKRKKETSRVKHKPVRNGGSGRPNQWCIGIPVTMLLQLIFKWCPIRTVYSTISWQ